MQERNFTPAGMELNSKLRAGAKIRGAVVDVAERAADDFDFAERLTELNEELERLNAEARVLAEYISQNAANLLEQSV